MPFVTCGLALTVIPDLSKDYASFCVIPDLIRDLPGLQNREIPAQGPG